MDIGDEAIAVVIAGALAIEDLRGILEPVEQQCGEHEQLVDDTVCSQHDRATLRSQAG